MAIASSTSAGFFVFASSFMPASFEVLANVFMPANPPVPVGLVLFSHTSWPMVQDMTKSFFIEKSVIAADNTTAQMYTKNTI